MTTTVVVGLIAGIAIGLVVGYFLRRLIVAGKINTAESKAADIVRKAKTKQQEIELEAQKKSVSFIEKAKQEEKARHEELKEQRDALAKREEAFEARILELDTRQKEIEEVKSGLSEKTEEIEALSNKYQKKLESTAKLTRDEAKKELLSAVERSEKDALLSRIQKMQHIGEEELEQKAHKTLALAVQKCSMNHNSEITSSIIDIPSDEMKGRIIGKEGRNIKMLEKLTGVEVIIDETPGVITMTSFSPLRRHVATETLKKLIHDGRIQPARIEETVEVVKKEVALEIKKAGDAALYELGITGIDPKLVQILGRLKFRTSYGQNQLLHSMEVAKISAKLAEELGADVMICKKGGLFHDIGKAVDQEMEGSHPQIGYDIMKKFGFPEEIAYQCISHHEDHPETVEGIIVKVADAISGGRPGARRDSAENYVQRLTELENLANGFEGVEKSYAIQAGRDLRVFVTPEKIDDLAAYNLAKEIADRIENNLNYAGEIKVSVIRETRAVEYAK